MNTIRYGLTNSLTRDVSGKRVSDIINDRNLQAALGFGANVQIRIDGRVAQVNDTIPRGSVLDIEVVANRKASEVKITLRYGPGNELIRNVPENTTVKQVLTNASFRTVLGFGDNSIAKIDGSLVRDDVYVRDGMVIDIETAANQKAV